LIVLLLLGVLLLVVGGIYPTRVMVIGPQHTGHVLTGAGFGTITGGGVFVVLVMSRSINIIRGDDSFDLLL
jgi:hypothetical protein